MQTFVFFAEAKQILVPDEAAQALHLVFSEAGRAQISGALAQHQRAEKLDP